MPTHLPIAALCAVRIYALSHHLITHTRVEPTSTCPARPPAEGLSLRAVHEGWREGGVHNEGARERGRL